MKRNHDFILRQVADNWVLVPVGTTAMDFYGMINLNASAAQLWRALEQGADREKLVALLMSEYDVTREQAQADVDLFIEKLHQAGCLSE